MSRPSQGTEEAKLELDAGIAALVRSALEKRVTSQSNVSGTTITGNRYQTVRLGDETIGGFREARQELYAGMQLERRSVCDLGANLGETARDAARHGARLVDAYEYDEYFTRIAQLVSVHENLYDVTHIPADVSKRGFLRRDYDVCVALAVYAYIEHITDYVTDHVKETMLVETHSIDSSWLARYPGRLSKKLPYWGVLGIIAHGDTSDASKRRLRMIFSKDPLDAFYVRRGRELQDHLGALQSVDTRASTSPSLAGPLAKFADGPRSVDDLTRMRPFLRDALQEYEDAHGRGESVDASIHGGAYWTAFLHDLSAHLAGDGEDVANGAFFTWVKRNVLAGTGDPGFVGRPDLDEYLTMRVRNRLDGIVTFLHAKERGDNVHPITLYCATPKNDVVANRGAHTFKVDGVDLTVPVVDGHHRLFLAYLFGWESIPAQMIWDESFLRFSSDEALGRNYADRMWQFVGGQDVDEVKFGDE